MILGLNFGTHEKHVSRMSNDNEILNYETKCGVQREWTNVAFGKLVKLLTQLHPCIKLKWEHIKSNAILSPEVCSIGYHN